MPDNERITSGQMKFLEALATYRYLTADQAVRLGVSSCRTSCNQNIITPIKKTCSPLVHFEDFGTIGMKRIPHIHCLNKHGAKILAEYQGVSVDLIPFPKDGIRFTIDAPHRIATIDTAIEVNLWGERTNTDIDFMDFYFDQKIIAARPRRLKIPLDPGRKQTGIIPDLVLSFSRGPKQPSAYVIEIHRAPRTTNIFDQLLNHAKAISARAYVAVREDMKVNPRILSIHQAETTFDRVREKVHADKRLANLQPFFLFNTLEQVRSDLTKGWTFADGKAVQAFDNPTTN